MSESIISIGGRVFQRFLSQLTSGLPKPNAKFIRDFLCGVLFSDNLVLTHIDTHCRQSSLFQQINGYCQTISQAVSQSPILS